MLERMLKREEELRTCEATQKEMARVQEHGAGDWMQVVEGLQRQVCDEFSVEHKAGLDALRNATRLFPEHADQLRKISLYRRHNRAFAGDLQVGMPCPIPHLLSSCGTAAVPLLPPSASSCNTKKNKKHLIVAGSFT